MVQITKQQLKPGVTVLGFKGSIHCGQDCRRVEQEVENLIRSNETRVIFDLSEVTHIDSAAIGAIVRCFSSLKNSRGALRLAGVEGMLEGTLKLTQVHRFLEIYPTASDAAENFPLPSAASEPAGPDNG